MNVSQIFPFPSKELALAELERDACYPKINRNDISAIIDRAWQTGVSAAQELRSSSGDERDFGVITHDSGLTVRLVEKDYIAGGTTRYFSEYLSGKKLIMLYTLSIKLWAKNNSLQPELAQNLILAHEFFHFLEWTKLGLTSKQHLVYMLKIGSIKIGRTGIRALSEIGAHAFARTYFNIDSIPDQTKLD
jgi:hypothetical protein